MHSFNGRDIYTVCTIYTMQYFGSNPKDHGFNLDFKHTTQLDAWLQDKGIAETKVRMDIPINDRIQMPDVHQCK